MSVKLSVEIEGPISREDREVLQGAAMVILALATNEANAHPDEESEEVPVEKDPDPFGAIAFVMHAADKLPEQPEPCGKVEQGSDRICVGYVGHRGRHLYRHLAN
jgi:hypothetical protein